MSSEGTFTMESVLVALMGVALVSAGLIAWPARGRDRPVGGRGWDRAGAVMFGGTGLMALLFVAGVHGLA